MTQELTQAIELLTQLSQKNSLGIPLPTGRVRVYKRDPADNDLEIDLATGAWSPAR